MPGKDANMADVYQVFPLIQEAEVSFEFNSINNDPCLSRKRWVQGYMYTAMEKLYQLVHEGSLTETEAYCILSGGRGQILPRKKAHGRRPDQRGVYGPQPGDLRLHRGRSDGV